jgi:hypothetical protein
MAWRWLLALGWRCTRVKKGVYMDGHERPDVVKYWDDVFLPLMASYKRCMVQWRAKGSGFVRIEPDLGLDEQRVIAVFQDESCFHVNDNKQTSWCVPSSQLLRDIIFTPSDRNKEGKQKLVKKGRGRIIHVLDFVKEENGCLIIRDQEGIVRKDAQCITYPGLGGDLWWDHAQLLMQVERAISIFEEAHPGCIGLFLFDHSSAHASLGPDALRMWDMNKSNGGKQRKQKDTTIPMNNPDVEHHGKPQKMTTEAGEAKGLQQTLEERGFSVRGMHVKCAPVCPFKNNNCCMARLLSKQDDF